MTSTFLYGTFRANECVCLDIHGFYSFDNWLCDPISEYWQLTLCVIFTIVYVEHMVPINQPLVLLISFLNQARTGCRLACTWFLKIVSVWMFVCLCVSAPKVVNN